MDIIAEIGQAHEGSLGIAHSYIDALSNTGVTSVKFQTHIAEAESSEFEDFRVKFSYEDKTRYDYWKRMEFTIDQWAGLKNHCEDKNLEFHITPNLIQYSDKLKNHNIFLRTIGSRGEMIDELKHSRVLLYLGHKSDIFTLTAEEAIKLCVPVITYGIGSLSERVSHGNNGFIAKNSTEFAKYTLDLMNDDTILRELKTKMFKKRLEITWSVIADTWIKNFLR